MLPVLALLTAGYIYAQRGSGPSQRTRIYDPANETTVKGSVEEVKTVTGRSAWNGTHLILQTRNNVTDLQERIVEGRVVSRELRTEARTIDVHVGPAAFLKEKGFSFAKGDEIEVTGAKAGSGASQVIIAREVKKNGKTLVLRNAQGIPKWAGGWRR